MAERGGRSGRWGRVGAGRDMKSLLRDPVAPAREDHPHLNPLPVEGRGGKTPSPLAGEGWGEGGRSRGIVDSGMAERGAGRGRWGRVGAGRDMRSLLRDPVAPAGSPALPPGVHPHLNPLPSRERRKKARRAGLFPWRERGPGCGVRRRRGPLDTRRYSGCARVVCLPQGELRVSVRFPPTRGATPRRDGFPRPETFEQPSFPLNNRHSRAGGNPGLGGSLLGTLGISATLSPTGGVTQRSPFAGMTEGCGAARAPRYAG